MQFNLIFRNCTNVTYQFVHYNKVVLIKFKWGRGGREGACGLFPLNSDLVYSYDLDTTIPYIYKFSRWEGGFHTPLTPPPQMFHMLDYIQWQIKVNMNGQTDPMLDWFLLNGTLLLDFVTEMKSLNKNDID